MKYPPAVSRPRKDFLGKLTEEEIENDVVPLSTLNLNNLFLFGGQGSGHKGHKGIKGQVGGSLPGHGGGTVEQEDPFDAKDISDKKIDEFYSSLTERVLEIDENEQEAIEAYTGDDYAEINDYWRGRRPEEIDAEYVGSLSSSLDSVFEEEGAVAPENLLLYRKVGFKPERSQKMIDFFEKGEGTFSDSSYLSTSLSERSTSPFSSPIGEVEHTFRIQVPKGTKMFPVDNWSSNPGEFEIIFPRDTKFEIISSRWNEHENEQQVLLKVIQ